MALYLCITHIYICISHRLRSGHIKYGSEEGNQQMYSGTFSQRLEFLWEEGCGQRRCGQIVLEPAQLWFDDILLYALWRSSEEPKLQKGVPFGLKPLSHVNTVQKAMHYWEGLGSSNSTVFTAIKTLNKLCIIVMPLDCSCGSWQWMSGENPQGFAS